MGVPFNPCFFFLLFPLMVLLYFAHGEDEFLPSNCTKEFPCGSVGSLVFPFAPHTHPHCGLIAVDCDAKPFPTLHMETGGDSYQLQLVKPSPVWGDYVIFLGDVKLQSLFDAHNYSNLNYTLQFPYSPSITFHNLKAKELNPTFLKCNYSEADDMGNYERYNCTQEFSFTLNYKHPLSPQNPKFEAPNYTLYPTPILVKQTNAVLTAQFGLEFQVSPACYDCYYNQGGQCTTDGKNKFHCKKDELPSNCTKEFLCGSMGYLEFPFAQHTQPHCGLIVVYCDAKPLPTLQLETGEHWYQLVSNDLLPNTIFLEDWELQGLLESGNYSNLNYTLQFHNSQSITFSNSIMTRSPLLECNHSLADDIGNYERHNCTEGFSFSLKYKSDLVPENPKCDTANCTLYPSPILVQQTNALFTPHFGLHLKVSPVCYHCYYYGGFQCTAGSNNKSQCTEACNGCFYGEGKCTKDSNNESQCKRGKSKLRLVLITVLSGGLGLSLVSLAIFVVWRLKKLPFCACMDMITEIKNYQAVEEFLANHGALAPKRFSYSEVKKITNSFKDELGQGGFGSVYKGKLRNGDLVAVKVLKELKTNGEEFINEVASISRTSHVNIVTLIGYCIEGRKRVLVYEFMPNGSLEKFIYDNKSLTGRQLEWNMLLKISIGIARGLEYLHNGCNTRIIHLDIKPHNILLDEDFSPKISDFGLAKLCTKKESIVSIFGARGTIGYIAPEVVLNNIGGVSHKSDVYSYGMMVLEMVGGRKNVDIGASRNSKIYFPHWIYTRLALDDELGLMGVMNEEDNNCARKMLIVSLWCIQTDPSTRPSISRVVEMLEGKLEYLQIPPKPYLYSPTRSEEQH